MEGVLLLMWVDDILIFSPPGTPQLVSMKEALSRKYKMVDLGAAKSFIKIDILPDRAARTIALHQGRYIEGVVEDSGMHDANGHDTPMESKGKLCASSDELLRAVDMVRYQSIVGKIMYAMIATHLNLAFAVSTLGNFAGVILGLLSGCSAISSSLPFLLESSIPGILRWWASVILTGLGISIRANPPLALSSWFSLPVFSTGRLGRPKDSPEPVWTTVFEAGA